MSNNDENHNSLNLANDWIKESDSYVKTLGTELEKQKTNKSFLTTALEKVNQLMATADQHSKTLSNVSKALQLAQGVPLLTGGQLNDIIKQAKDVDDIIQKLLTAQNALKGFKEKITSYLEAVPATPQPTPTEDQTPPKT